MTRAKTGKSVYSGMRLIYFHVFPVPFWMNVIFGVVCRTLGHFYKITSKWKRPMKKQRKIAHKRSKLIINIFFLGFFNWIVMSELFLFQISVLHLISLLLIWPFVLLSNFLNFVAKFSTTCELIHMIRWMASKGILENKSESREQGQKQSSRGVL